MFFVLYSKMLNPYRRISFTFSQPRMYGWQTGAGIQVNDTIRLCHTHLPAPDITACACHLRCPQFSCDLYTDLYVPDIRLDDAEMMIWCCGYDDDDDCDSSKGSYASVYLQMVFNDFVTLSVRVSLAFLSYTIICGRNCNVSVCVTCNM